MIIRKLRLQRGWSQEQLSQFTGLSSRTIQRIEKGQTPSLESLKSLAAVFEIDVNDLQMEPNMNSKLYVTDEERQALDAVRKLKGFYGHLCKYVCVMVLLFAINLITHPDYIWAFWPLFGWGAGLTFHGLRVFNVVKLWGPEWERKQVEKRLGRKL
ncbi:2TM domain-containing protein [Vibrio zhugei]|uniref:2TM domain-containing protein n=1 Tax=Vibrio zhugei TaxID=2479546 RepID=A0ABV7CBN6_9VIBR|nr:helix-turn-helix domain-containing protein [Vibrio zhugei]